MAIPLRGQGSPLPPNFLYTGEWLLQPRIFLYVSTDEQRGTPGKPTFTANVNSTSEDWSVGFDATELAAGLGVSVEALFLANRGKGLSLERIEADTPDGEGATIKRYVFRLGKKEAGATIVTPSISGIA